jgi:hypothetical protein
MAIFASLKAEINHFEFFKIFSGCRPNVSLGRPIVFPDKSVSSRETETEIQMIKPLNTPQLSSAKPRCGLQSVSDLLPRLIRQYELQAEIARRNQPQRATVIVPPLVSSNHEQATFSWYE